jgi:hypothetical protein
LTIRSPRERETTGYLKLPPTKPGEPKLQNLWLKAHIVAGTKTHVIPWVVVTEGHANDSPFLPTLVNQTLNSGFVLNEVYADKGYLSDQNYRAIGTTGATPYIAFKSNSRGRVKDQEVKTRFWKTVWHFFQSNPTLFFEHYYQRENVEAVFAAIKKKLGETLSSKDPVSQRNELLCKIIS